MDFFLKNSFLFQSSLLFGRPQMHEGVVVVWNVFEQSYSIRFVQNVSYSMFITFQTLSEWKATRREELSEYQKQIAEQYLGNVEKDLERWQNARKARRPNNDANLQETMDKELDTHRLEHGPKTRKIPGGSNNEDEEDVEDINVGEDDMMDDVLVVDDNVRRDDEAAKPETGSTSGSAPPDNLDQ